MENNFITNFEILVENTISEAHVRLWKQNPEYRTKSDRLWDIREKLESLLKDGDACPSAQHWGLVREYLELDFDRFTPEHAATYLQAILDCIHLLHHMGQL